MCCSGKPVMVVAHRDIANVRALHQVHFFIYTGGLLEGSNFFLGAQFAVSLTSDLVPERSPVL